MFDVFVPSIILPLAAPLFIFAILVFALWRSMVWMPGRSYRGDFAPLDEQEMTIRDALQRDLIVLSDDIGERNVSHRYAKLADAARFIERSLAVAGYEPQRDEFTVDERIVCNVGAELIGTRRPEEVIVVGAHYDSVPGSPGANDNGSAVVANLALARALAGVAVERTLRFVFFVNEESPYYMTDAMGSLRCARACRDRGEQVVGMISLETIGCYVHRAHSQQYPTKWLEWLYPTTGNFIAVVGNVRSRRWVHAVVRGLRKTRFRCEGMAAPRFLKDIFRSDHAAFWHCGYPALMITDTANFRYPHYHTAEDTPDKINYDALARVVKALEVALVDLGTRAE